MNRPWAVLFTALLLGGCRSAQPTTNPFMQTTVPPPGTAPGMMVMPGEAYAPGTAPPVVTTPAPVSPAVPVTPAQPAPLINPPPAGPEQREFHPPGGSYLYHQSSNDPPVTAGSDSPIRLASAAEPIATTAAETSNQVRFASTPVATGAAEQREEITLSTGAATTSTSLRLQPAAEVANRGDPPEGPTLTVGATKWRSAVHIRDEAPAAPSAGGTTLAVGPPSAANQAQFVSPATSSAPVASPASSTGVVRMTAGSNATAVTMQNQSGGAAGGASASRISIVATGNPVAPAAATMTLRDGSPVATSAFQPVTRPAYYHSPDYGTLRGRLEYLQSRRQWKLRYIPIDGRTDDYGGSVILADFPGLASHQPGDMVEARGKLAAGGTAGYSPRYELLAIEPASP